MQFYIASSGDSDPNGIYRFTLDTDTGAIQQTGANGDITDGLYLVEHRAKSTLYAVGGGEIVAFRVSEGGDLTCINRQPTDGYEPCYISLTRDGKYALVINYTGPDDAGSIAVFPLREDGGVAPAVVQMRPPGEGARVHATRQNAPHPHMILPLPGTDFVLVLDLGMDVMLIYTLDHATGQITPHTTPHISLEPGSGPRHLVFHPTERVFYVLGELATILTVIAYDTDGNFTILATHSTMPPGEAAPDHNLGADIRILPSGKFLYASNRGHNSLAIFAVSDDGRTLDYVGHESTKGNWPRSFAIDPTGRVLVASNQYSGDLYTFHIAPDTGLLTPTGHSAAVSGPVCVYF